MPKESLLQSKIKRWLTRRGWLVVKISLTSKPGWPDLFLLKDGKNLFLEIKDGTKPKELQYYRQAEIRKHGGTSLIITSWDEFLALGLD